MKLTAKRVKMKKLLLSTILTIGSTSAYADTYEYCKKYSDLGGDTLVMRSEGHKKEEILKAIKKAGVLTVENEALINLAYAVPMTSDLHGDVANVKRMVFSVCMDSMGK